MTQGREQEDAPAFAGEQRHTLARRCKAGGDALALRKCSRSGADSRGEQRRLSWHIPTRLGSEQDGLRHETWASKNTERRVSAHASTTTDASFEEGSGGGTASTGRSELVESRRPEVVCTRRSGKGSRKTGRLGEWIAKHHTHKSVQTDFQV